MKKSIEKTMMFDPDKDADKMKSSQKSFFKGYRPQFYFRKGDGK